MRDLDADVLRLSSITLVILFHLGLFNFGWIGVDLFLFLSGYFSAKSLNKYSLLEFLSHRARRITPPFLICIILIYAASLVIMPALLIKENFIAYVYPVVHVQNVVLYYKEADYFNNVNWALPTFHFWSLSLEVQLYFFIAAVSVLVKQMNVTTTRYFITFYSIIFLSYYWGSQINEVYYDPLYRSFMFLIGFFYTHLRTRHFLFAISCFALSLDTVLIFVLLLPGVLLKLQLSYKLIPEFIQPSINKSAYYTYEIYLYHWPIICFYGWLL